MTWGGSCFSRPALRFFALALEARVERLDQILSMRGHVLLDRHPWRHVDVVEVQTDPAGVLPLAENPDQRRKIDATSAEPLIDRIGRRREPELFGHGGFLFLARR